MKSLTVIILYSEREQILEESIQSIWKLNPLEIIILVPNDRSNLYEIAKKHKCHIVLMDKYSTYYDGYEASVKAAKGDVLLFVDSNFYYPQMKCRDLLSQLLQIKPM